MSYKSKFGITPIRASKTYALSISWDYDSNPKKRFPVFLFTPNIDDTDQHYHIELTAAQTRKLRDWLNDYLRDMKRAPSKRTRR